MKLRYKLALGSFVGLLAFIAAVAWLIQWSGQRALEHEIQQVIAAGGARDFSAYADLQIPDDQNAALAWLAANAELERINALGLGPGDEDIIDGLYGTDLEAIERVITARQSVIEKAWAAAELEAVRWPLDYSDPNSFLTGGFLSHTRRLSRFLLVDVYLSIKRGDTQRADRSLTAVLSLADDVTELPLLINSLVAISIDAMVIETLKEAKIENFGGLDRSLDVFKSRDYGEWMSESYLGEVSFILGYELSPEEEPEIEAWLKVPVKLWRNHDVAFYVSKIRQLSELAKAPYFTILPQVDAIENYDFPLVYPLSEAYMPAVLACFRTTARAELKRDLLVWSSELNRGVANGDPPVDVLTGDPIQSWEAEDGGWVAWSVRAEMNAPEIRDREGKVWRLGTQLLPPSLQPFADELVESDDDEFGY